MFDINELTLGQIKEIALLINNNQKTESSGLDMMIGKKVIIRTYSAGVWFGTLIQKDRNEVILSDARRMWRWKTKHGISLSAVAVDGINQKESKITGKVENVWLEAIEIIPCTVIAIESIEDAKNVEAE